MRRLALFVAVVLLLSACGSEVAEEATTTSVAAEAPATTVVQSTSTTEGHGPVDICRGRAELWEPGRTYSAECFVLPVSFVVSDDGWRSRAPQEDWVFVSWVDPDDRTFRVNVAVTAMRTTGGPESRIEAILETEGISAISEVTQQRVVGLDSLVVDVEGAAGGQRALGGRECSTDATFVLHLRDQEGYLIATGPEDGDFFGVGACQVTRLWVFDVGEYTLTIIGGTADPARHEEAVEKAESLFGGMTLQTSGAG